MLPLLLLQLQERKALQIKRQRQRTVFGRGKRADSIMGLLLLLLLPSWICPLHCTACGVCASARRRAGPEAHHVLLVLLALLAFLLLDDANSNATLHVGEGSKCSRKKTKTVGFVRVWRQI
jgi:hypothetical protein